MSTLSKRIREERLKAKMTEKELAKKCGLSPSYIMDIESDKKVINEKIAEKILSVFGDKSTIDAFYNQEAPAETVAKPKEQPKQKETVYDIRPNEQWSDALANVIKKFPVHDMISGKVVGSKELPVLNKKIEGINWDKLMFVKVSDEESEGLRIRKNDIVWINTMNDINSNGIYLVELGGKKMIRRVNKLGNKVELSKGRVGETPLSTEIKKVKILGKCVRAEFEI